MIIGVYGKTKGKKRKRKTAKLLVVYLCYRVFLSLAIARGRSNVDE